MTDAIFASQVVTVAAAVLVVALLAACGATPESTQISTTPESTGVSARPQPTHVTAEASHTAAPADPLYTQLTAGTQHSCALDSDGVVVCWGSNEYGQLAVPPDERMTEIEAGGFHTCGLRTNESAVCWGHKFDIPEELGEEFRASYSPPFPPESESFVSIVVNGDTCGLQEEGGVLCWRIGGEQYSIFEEEEIVAISSGEGFEICGLRQDGRVICRGLGVVSPPDGKQFVEISTGFVHACGLYSDGAIECWGDDLAGQLSPPENMQFSSLATGSLHSCALRTDGTALCWGYDLERLEETYTPLFQTAKSRGEHRLPLPDNERFTEITAGFGHACGVRQDGGISCWGNNDEGQATPPGA